MARGGWTWAVGLALALVPGPGWAQEGGLEPLGFMSGTWCSEPNDAGTAIEEHYSSPSLDLMVGTTRFLRRGRTVSYEFSTLEVDSAGVVLTPRPSGQEPVPFRLVETGEGRAVFENPTHDFPARIAYRRTAEGLSVRVEGADGEGTTWSMSPCPAAGGTGPPGG